MNFFLHKKSLSIVLILVSSFFGLAQKNNGLVYLSGKISSSEGNYLVALAHVVNLNQHWMVKADTTGHFQIWASKGDTLHFSAIGFEYLEYAVSKITVDSIVQISLRNKTYVIPEVRITSLGSYKDFKYKVINLKLPELGINPQVEKLFKHVDFPLETKPIVTSPASLIYCLFSKEAQELKKYFEIMENQDKLAELGRRYNVHVINNLTGLQGKEAKSFMEFCNFQDLYILGISDYNLYSEIKLRYEAYKNRSFDSELLE